MLRMQLSVRVGLGFAPAWCRACRRGRNGSRVHQWRLPSRGANHWCRWSLRAASGAPGRSTRHMLRSSEPGIDNVEEASRASEEARLCFTDSGAAEDRRKPFEHGTEYPAHHERYDAAARSEWRGPERTQRSMGIKGTYDAREHESQAAHAMRAAPRSDAAEGARAPGAGDWNREAHEISAQEDAHANASSI
ncbi:hypothetical protein B0H14DRAFT_2577641 [Mycena olivaceomarginata]|nr:hypothetical protein B0H14DRAFT_2577641 [Mycena olivaceomarginata]